MKQFIYLLLFAIIHVPVKSQNLVQIPVVNLQAKVEGKQVLLVWHSDEDADWEVQASADGKTFTTVGLVWGQDPKGSRGSFAFKQEATKIGKGKSYFRVVKSDTNTSSASNVARISK